MSKVKPSKEAMLVCDQIITEGGTNKKTLVGIFEQIYASKLPCMHPSLSVYIKFTAALGTYQFRLELVDLQTNTVIGNGTLPNQTIEDKLTSYELVFNLRSLKFTNRGKYEFRIYADEELFGTKTFHVLTSPAGPGEK